MARDVHELGAHLGRGLERRVVSGVSKSRDPHAAAARGLRQINARSLRSTKEVHQAEFEANAAWLCLL